MLAEKRYAQPLRIGSMRELNRYLQPLRDHFSADATCVRILLLTSPT